MINREKVVKVLIVTGAFGLLVKLYLNHKFRDILKLPSPPAYPIVGHVPMLEPEKDAKGDLKKTRFWKWLCDHPRLMVIWLGFLTPVITVQHPETIKQVLSHSSPKADLYQFLSPWLGDGLLLSSGDKWKSRRRLLTPAFHFEILKDFAEIFSEQAEVLVNKLEKEHGDGKPFNIFPYVTHCVLEIICLTAMGKNINCQENGDTDYVRAVYLSSENAWERIKTPWYWWDLLYYLLPVGVADKKALKILHKFTGDVIKERREEFQQFGLSKRPNHRLAFLDLLLQADPPLSDSDLQEEVDTFMFEGHDTTSSGISWTLWCLARNQHCLKKAQAEVDKILATSNTSTPTYEDAKKYLEYTTQCIKEAMRLLPPVPFIARVMSEDIEIDGNIVREGSTVAILPLMAHINPQIWDDPMTYNPDRFSDQQMKGRHPFAYIPFSAGSRNCIGQNFAELEERIVVASIIHKFDLYVDQSFDPDPRPELILRPHKGILLSLKKRTPSSASDTPSQ